MKSNNHPSSKPTMIRKLVDANGRFLGYRVDHEPQNSGTAFILASGGAVSVIGDLQPIIPLPVRRYSAEGGGGTAYGGGYGGGRYADY